MEFVDLGDILRVLFIFGIFYVVFWWLKKLFGKLMQQSPEKRENLFTGAKIFLASLIAGLVLYLIPAIPEVVKIIMSLAITIGSFVFTFIVKEKNGYNFLARIMIFVGQMFFGLTMFLIMVNTNLGYSAFSIFAIWTVFNLYIYYEFSKPENAVMVIATIIGTLILAIGAYITNISVVLWVSVICILLVLMQLLDKMQDLLGKSIHNILLSALAIMLLINKTDESILLLVISLIYAVASIALLLLKEKSINLKSLFVYLPLSVFILFEGFGEGLSFKIAIFTFIFTIMVLSEKSIYKKVITTFLLLVSTCALIQEGSMDELYNYVILASAALSFIFILESFSVKKLDKRGEGNDEE